MKIPRIYIDTSVIGGCFDSEFAQWSNGLMEDFRLGVLKPILSDLLETELKNAPTPVQSLYADLITWQAEFVVTTEKAFNLANIYQQREILTPKYYDDGLHVALATIAEVDIIVSWNFKHIVHFLKINKFNKVNLEFGYQPLQIYSPREVIQYGKD